MRNKNFTYNNIEELLQAESENYVAYPNDAVWNNIRIELHGIRRWRALLVGFLLCIIAASVTTLMFYPKPRIVEAISAVNFKIHEKKLYKNQVNILASSSSNLQNEQTKNSLINLTKFNPNQANINEELVSIKPKTDKSFYIKDNNLIDVLIVSNIINPLLNNNQINKAVDNLLVTSYETENKISCIKNIEENNNVNTNKIDLPKKTKMSKWQIEYYTTPSVSYRNLDEDKSRFNIANTAINMQDKNVNINNVVKHKAAVGTEVGIGLLYNISKNFAIKTGLQFNMRKYQIDASINPGTTQINFIENNQLSTNIVAAKYAINNGLNNVELDNTLYQLSVPIGVQFNVIDGEKFGLIAAATIQPTFYLNKSIYAVSTDYKYYVDGTPYFRRSNVNTSLEFLLSVKSKLGKFVMGPQIRYQQYSTFKDTYPIKENRIDYGIKVGLIKNL